ncbi:hypothetical protein RDWZM_008356 [Blomia tropicalis]|uniref:Protein kinase domain-containing protein n=1 Tax=Blomia tropicalis TaxID=40697 RepID=A0A9Q0M186_BLOTA|nr:hypothetical protein RDWZM_008356 [Blomia tropicalis]
MFSKFTNKLVQRIRSLKTERSVSQHPNRDKNFNIVKSFDNVFDDFKFDFVDDEAYESQRFDCPINHIKDIIDINDSKRLIRHEMQYTHLKELGTGNFGTVFKVRAKVDDSSHTKEVACKVFNFGCNWNSNKASFTEKFESFQVEGRIQQIGLVHEHIRRYYNVYQIYCSTPDSVDNFNLIKLDHDGKLPDNQYKLIQAGILMELVHSTLYEWMINHNIEKFSEMQAKEAFFQIGKALTYLHEEHNLCHNDLKMDNIGIEADLGLEQLPKLKLLDFGISKRYSKKLYEEAVEQSKLITIEKPMLSDSKPRQFKSGVTPFSHLISGNAFLCESYLFANLIIMMLSVNINETAMDIEFIRNQFIHCHQLKDSRFKAVLVQMSEPDKQKRVTVKWGLEQLTK